MYEAIVELYRRVGTIVDQKKVLKQAGVVHDTINQLKLLFPYTACVFPFWYDMHAQ